ncbi:MAG TPA: VTT domain-containing protein [Usitatibacter sp.]|nr:VTT domain-containing protein [Usitatibacter sp.]
MKVARKHWFWIALAAAALLAVGVAALAPVDEWEDALESSLENMSLGKGLLVFCAIYIVGSLLLLPAWVFAIAAGAVFGMAWGLVAAVASSMLAAVAAFLVARYLFRGRFEAIAKKNETFSAVDKAVRRDPWKVVALLRMSPVLPSGLKSYFLGLTCVKTIPYTWATIVGMFPGLAVKVYVGHAGRDVVSSGGPLKWALLAVALAATVAMGTLVSRMARKRLRL